MIHADMKSSPWLHFLMKCENGETLEDAMDFLFVANAIMIGFDAKSFDKIKAIRLLFEKNDKYIRTLDIQKFFTKSFEKLRDLRNAQRKVIHVNELKWVKHYIKWILDIEKYEEDVYY